MGNYKFTNKHDVSLALAVFLMYDQYDHDDRQNCISATGLIKPLRQLILSHQHSNLDKEVDISDLVASRMGTAIHDGCQQAWEDTENVSQALIALGASASSIERVVVNPQSAIGEGQIPVYVEQRHEKEIDGYVITGKFDLVLDGTVNDYKSTSVWTYIYDSNADSYTKQGSIYKWLTPDKITSDYININYIFTDWSAAKARQDPRAYPPQRVLTKKYPLWSESATEEWIRNKLDMFTRNLNNPQEAIPECTKEELWASETVFKYYKDPAKKARSTKNFSTMDEALIKKSNDGDVGEIVEVPGEVKACRYCKVVSICTQAEGMLASGRLVL